MSEQGRYGHACHGRTGAARRHLQLTLPACGQPVQLARQVTREVLTGWRLAHVEETAVLLVSELVTNAVRHAASTDAITLELQVVHTWLRIEAYRCRPGLAVPRTTGEFDEPGLGFALVDCLAGKWGWIAWPASGECVRRRTIRPAGQDQGMDESTEGQLRVIRKVIAVTQSAGIPVWLFGGWGLDARIGRITREHGDVEFWVERSDAERSKAVLAEAGATALATQPPEEACEFTWDDVLFSTAYFDRQPDGSFVQLLGRFSDWLFPPGSFGGEPGTLDGMPVPAMSVSGMLAMKEQFPHLRNGQPWRQKDIRDIEILRGLAAEGRAGK